LRRMSYSVRMSSTRRRWIWPGASRSLSLPSSSGASFPSIGTFSTRPPAMAPLPDFRQAAWIRRRQRRSSSSPVSGLAGAALDGSRRFDAAFFAGRLLAVVRGAAFFAGAFFATLVAAFLRGGFFATLVDFLRAPLRAAVL